MNSRSIITFYSSELILALVFEMMLELSLLITSSRECLTVPLALSLLKKDDSEALRQIVGSLYDAYYWVSLKSYFSKCLIICFCCSRVYCTLLICCCLSDRLLWRWLRMEQQLVSSWVSDNISECSFPLVDLVGSSFSSSCFCRTSFLVMSWDLIMLSFCSLRQLRQFSFLHTTSILGASSFTYALQFAATLSYSSSRGEVKLCLAGVLSQQEDLFLWCSLGKGSSSILSVYGRLQHAYNNFNMDSPLDWKDNKYQPGLFTFYMQQHSLSPLPLHGPSPTRRADINSRTFRSEIKIPPKYRLNNRYRCFNDSITAGPEQKEQRNRRASQSLRTLGQKGLNSERFSVRNPRTQRNREGVSKSTVKNTNMNKYFHYDINKQRSKMFIYRGQPSNFVKKLSKRLQKNPQAEEGRRRGESKGWRIKTEYTITEHQKHSINSDERLLSKTRDRLNFLQFLIQRNRQHHALKPDSSRERIELTLTKLAHFNHPCLLSVAQGGTAVQ